MAVKNNLSKSSILKVSAELFRKQSFSQVSMRDIAHKLDVKAASLYNHITSKDEILDTLIFDFVDIFMQSMQTTSIKSINTKHKLNEIILTHISVVTKSPNQFAVLNKDWIFLKPDKKALFLSKRQEYEKSLKNIIIKGIENNEIKPSHPEIIIYIILSSLRTLHLWYEKKVVKRSDLKSEIPKLILQGITT